jgi:hypothetical protein
MPNSYSAPDLLSIFKDAYQSVDIRWAAARNKDQWLLVALSVRVRVDSSELASKRFHDDLEKITGLESSTIRMFQRTYSIAEVQSVAQMILSGRLVLEGMEFAQLECRDIMTQHGCIQLEESDASTRQWPQLHHEMKLHNDNSVTQIFLNDSKLSRATDLAGYKNPDAAVGHLLGVGFTSNSIGGFWLTMDVPLRMLAHTVSKIGDELVLGIHAEAHSTIDDVSCAVRITKSDRGERTLPVAKLSRLAGDSDIVQWQTEIPLVLQRDDFLEVDILCHNAGRLYSKREWAHSLMPIELANPLFAALTMFCPSDTFRSLLTQPETAEPSKRVKQDHRASLFEISVQWLLSALGLQAVWLHGYEICKEGKVRVGAVDCLAYSEREKLLLLVNCSLGAPDPAELNQHAAFCAKVSKGFSRISHVKVLAVMVTATLAPEGRRPDSSVVILYKDDLEALLKAAESGQHVEFSRYTNPILRGHVFS